MGEGFSGDQGYSLWYFLATIVTVVGTQFGLSRSARNVANKKADQMRRRSPDELQRDAEILMDKKDDRAFQIVLDRLKAAEASRAACELECSDMRKEMNKLARRFDIQNIRHILMAAAMTKAGIEIPQIDLPGG